MSEKAAWATLRAALCGHIQRFEDKLAGGIPDSYVKLGRGYPGAWLEGKYLKAWPKRARTPVRLDLRADQALWLNLEKRVGGCAFVWVRVPGGWYLFDGWFSELRDGMPRDDFELRGYSCKTAADVVETLKRCLSGEEKKGAVAVHSVRTVRGKLCPKCGLEQGHS